MFRSKFQSLLLVLGATLILGEAHAAELTFKLDPTLVKSRIQKDLGFLASDVCEGRGPTTKGINVAADYIAKQFKAAGLKPLMKNGSYFQPFTINGAILEEPATLTLKGPKGQTIQLKQGVHFHSMGMGGAGSAKDAGIVFAGYGITGSQRFDYDDYADLDVEGKVVIVLRDTPCADNRFISFDGPNRRRHASLTEKMSLARKHKAAAIIFVSDIGSAHEGDDLLDFNYTALSRRRIDIPAFHMKRSVLESLLQSQYARDIDSFEKEISRTLKPASRGLDQWSASFSVKLKRGEIHVKNVVGTLEGSGKLANETVVIGAHYDHLGYGSGSSLANLKKMAIHYGADDNASGSTSLMELARRFGQREQPQDARRLVFIAFSAEELGLLGAHHYCKNPLIPLKSTVAMVNLDMVGRLAADRGSDQGKLEIGGVGTAKNFESLLDQLNARYKFKLSKKKSGFGPSDHSAFYERKIPVLFFFTGTHENYHKPSDTAEKVNYSGMQSIINMSAEIVHHLEIGSRPEYIEIKRAARRPGRGPGRNFPTLGIRPGDYDGDDGLEVGGVSPGGPAAVGGIKGGDRIVQIQGRQVKGINGYIAIMRMQKRGSTIKVVVLRDKKKIELKVPLE